jgi:hypothetical protein
MTTYRDADHLVRLAKQKLAVAESIRDQEKKRLENAESVLEAEKQNLAAAEQRLQQAAQAQ